MGKLRFLLSVILVSAVVLSLIALDVYVTNNKLEVKLVRISKQSPVVQNYLNRYPDALYRISMLYVKSDGSTYTVSDNWELVRCVGGGDAPVDGKSHYCWMVHWYRIGFVIPHIVNVFIDRDSWEIVSVEEAM